MFRLFAVSLICLLATACSWVALEKGAESVLVLPPERLTADCKSQGKVTVSVLDKVGVLERHDDEVVEDLNILARNHAVGRGGDTVVARGPVEAGARQYEVFRCTEGSPSAGDDAEARPKAPDDVEVIPYRGGD